MLQNDCVSHYCLHFFFIYILVLYRDPVIRKNSRNMFLLLWKFYILVCMEPRWLCFDFTSIILYFSFHCSIPLWYEVCGHWYIAKSVLFEFLNGNLDQFLCLSRSIFFHLCLSFVSFHCLQIIHYTRWYASTEFSPHDFVVWYFCIT